MLEFSLLSIIFFNDLDALGIYLGFLSVVTFLFGFFKQHLPIAIIKFLPMLTPCPSGEQLFLYGRCFGFFVREKNK